MDFQSRVRQTLVTSFSGQSIQLFQERVVRLASYLLLLGAIPSLVYTISLQPNSLPSWIASLSLLAGTVIGEVLSRRKQLRFASLSISTILWLYFTIMAVFSNGLQLMAFGGFIICIQVAHLLVGAKGARPFIWLSLTSGVASLAAASLGWLPVSEQSVPETFTYLIWTGLFVTIVILMRLSNITLEHALEISRKAQVQLERRAIQFQTAAEIARDSTFIFDLDELLERVVNLISQRFGVYFTAILLVDDNAEVVVLRAASGETGKQLLLVGHKLRLDGTGIIASAARLRRPHITPDVSKDSVHLSNPLLSATKSEVALPLIFQDRLTGVLDVQSENLGTLDEEIIKALMVMADQIAITLETARLVSSVRRQVEELTILHAVGLTAAEAQDEDELIEQITRIIGERMYPDNFGILLVDATSQTVVPHASYQERPGARQVVIALGEGITGLVAKDGKIRRIQDVRQISGYVEVDRETLSELAVPLKVDEQIIGVINAESRKINGFSGDDERLLTTIASQLGIAIQKLRLLKGEQQRRIEAETLRDSFNALTISLDLQSVLEQILVQLKRVVPYDGATIFLLRDSDQMYAVACQGDLEIDNILYKVFPLDFPLFQNAQATDQPVELQHLQSDFLNQQTTAYGKYVWISVPLVVRGELIGFLVIHHNDPNRQQPQHALLMQILAKSGAIAIQNARLYEAEQRRISELETLRQASLRVTSSLELHAVLEAILEQTFTLVHASDAHIFVYDGVKLTFGAAMWSGGIQRKPYSEPRPDGLTYQVARSGRRLAISNLAEDALFAGQGWTGAIIGLPLKIGERVLGVMNIAYPQPRHFDPNELRILELLADQAALSLENSRLYEDVLRQAEDLKRALVQLRQLDRMKSEFIQNVSHELRTPLSIIRGYAELLEAGDLGPLKAEQEGPVRVINRRVKGLSNMFEDLFTLMEAEARSQPLATIDFAGLVTQTVAEFENEAARAELHLRAEIPENLPSIKGHAGHLRRLLDNLIGNSIKFTPAGGSVEVRLSQDEKEIILEVNDTGIGISSDQQEKIFDRFYQIDGSASRRFGGTGLGLALVKEIVEAHGGQVKVQSQVGVGSSFRINFPI